MKITTIISRICLIIGMIFSAAALIMCFSSMNIPYDSVGALYHLGNNMRIFICACISVAFVAVGTIFSVVLCFMAKSDKFKEKGKTNEGERIMDNKTNKDNS